MGCPGRKRWIARDSTVGRLTFYRGLGLRRVPVPPRLTSRARIRAGSNSTNAPITEPQQRRHRKVLAGESEPPSRTPPARQVSASLGCTSPSGQPNQSLISPGWLVSLRIVESVSSAATRARTMPARTSVSKSATSSSPSGTPDVAEAAHQRARASPRLLDFSEDEGSPPPSRMTRPRRCRSRSDPVSPERD